MTINTLNNVTMRHIGSGVCVFEGAITLDWDWVYEEVKKLVSEDVANMYTPTINPETGKPALLNKSGYLFSSESFLSMPGRCSSAHQRTDEKIKQFLKFLEDSKDYYLLQYLARFPLAYKNIWWKVKGHIVGYKQEHLQYLGVHSDTSADYVYGFDHPSDQLATRNTLSCIVYFNDCNDGTSNTTKNSFSGGHHVFDELGIRYIPRKGDIIMFPSNFIASHLIEPVTCGERYSYLGWYCHGSPNSSFNESIVDPIKDPAMATVATNVYIPTLREDLKSYLEKNNADKSSQAYCLVRDGF